MLKFKLINNFKIQYLFFLFSMLFGYESIIYAQKEEKKKLADLIITSNIKEIVSKPEIEHHFELVDISTPSIDYFPNILPSKPPFEFNPAFNVKKIDGFFDFIGNLFSDRRKILTARNRELEGKSIDALRDYNELLNSKGQYGNEAALRILSSANSNKEEISLALSKLEQLDHPYYSTQLYIYKIFNDIKIENYEDAISHLKNWSDKYEAQYPSTTVEILHIYLELLKLNFSEAGKLATLFLAKHHNLAFLSSAYEYYAIAECHQSRYSSCAEQFINAADSAENIIESTRYRYYAAWAQYSSSVLAEAKILIGELDSRNLLDLGEFNYLMFLINFESNSSNEALKHYKLLPASSIWKQYAMLKMINEKKLLASNPSLAVEIEQTQFNFPEISSFKDFKIGYKAFTDNFYEKAEKSFVAALMNALQGDFADKIKFNLAQAYIKNRKFYDAAEIFKTLSTKGFNAEQSSYHLAYVLYQLDRADEITSIPTPALINSSEIAEFELLKAYGLLLKDSIDQSSKLLEASYKKYGLYAAIKLRSDIALMTEAFKITIDIYLNNKKKTEDLAINAGKSYLALDKSTEALKVVLPFVKSEKFRTRRVIIDAWNANSKFRDVSLYAEKWMVSTSDKKEKLYFGLQKSDAEYNQRNYKLAKDSYYSLLNLTDDLKDRSNLYFYIMSSSLNADDKSAFYAEGGKILKNPMDNEIRYQIVQMMVDAYLDDGKLEDATNILYIYQQEFEYRSSDVKLQRLGLMRSQEKWSECFLIGEKPFKGEEQQTIVNRVIEASFCAEKLNKYSWIQSEILSMAKILPEYRKIERSIFLAKAYNVEKNYQKMISLLEPLTKFPMQADISGIFKSLLGQAYLNLGKYEEASNTIGKSEELRGSKQFTIALMAEAEQNISENNYDEAARILLRSIFLPSISEDDKIIIGLRLGEVYILAGQNEDAKKALALVEYEKIFDSSLKERYEIAQKSLSD